MSQGDPFSEPREQAPHPGESSSRELLSLENGHLILEEAEGPC